MSPKRTLSSAGSNPCPPSSPPRSPPPPPQTISAELTARVPRPAAAPSVHCSAASTASISPHFYPGKAGRGGREAVGEVGLESYQKQLDEFYLTSSELWEDTLCEKHLDS